MNEYEFELYKIGKERGDSITRQLADICQQQADRIAELEKGIAEHFEEGYRAGYKFCANMYESTPQIKELSDKEITQVFDECYPNNGDGDVVTLIDFARAILKKASEK